MRLLFVLFTAVICSLQVQAQTILAGEHGPDDYYVDIDPDTTMFTTSYPFSTYPIDINGDNIIDVAIEGISGIAPGTSASWWQVTCYYDNQVAFAYTDSCSLQSSIAYAFELGEPINSQAIWNDNYLYLAWYFSFSNPSTICTGNNFFGPDPLYIGVKVFRETDVQYGWIQVADVDPWDITIQAYACNDYAVGLYNELKSDWYTIYPNPVHNQLVIHISDVWFKSSFRIFNIFGEKVLGENLTTRETVLDVSALQNGVYFIRLQRGNLFSIRKIIKY